MNRRDELYHLLVDMLEIKFSPFSFISISVGDLILMYLYKSKNVIKDSGT